MISYLTHTAVQIREFDFAPLISDADFKTILDGGMPPSKQYERWYIRDAINAWREKNMASKAANEQE